MAKTIHLSHPILTANRHVWHGEGSRAQATSKADPGDDQGGVHQPLPEGEREEGEGGEEDMSALRTAIRPEQ